MKKKLPIALLGATGVVGQKLITLIQEHPHFFIKEIAASDGATGRAYEKHVSWKNEYPLPKAVGRLLLTSPLDIKTSFVISALPLPIAKKIELELVKRGHIVCSNASAFRMHPNVPLIIPEVNASHLSLLSAQPWPGKILTNPNCSVAVLAGALHSLLCLGKIESISVVTLQALSGAGYPGIPAFDLLGNTIPYIEGEEEKITLETKKILGTPSQAASFALTVNVHRVPVLHGHTLTTHVRFESKVSAQAVLSAFQETEKNFPNFMKLHTSLDRPQPLRDLSPHESRIHIGRIKQGDHPNTISFISLGHNLVRGAAGAAIGCLDAYLKVSQN